MGFQVKKKKGSISEINVTPFVDVMLVLLVIFMITTPLMLNGIKLDLPKTKEVNPLALNTTQTVLSISKAGEYFLGDKKILKKELILAINETFSLNKTSILYLRADYKLEYGIIAKMMSFLKRSGVTQIALVTEIEK